MNAEQLLQHFERISEAPDAITRLRRFILDLAVRGKLVEQDPSDEPAAELLKRIAAEKARLAKGSGKGTLVKTHSRSAQYALPDSWIWSEVEAVSYIEMGQSPPSEHYNQHGEGVPFFQGKTDFGKINPTPRYWCTSPSKYAEPGDILLSVRAPVGPTNVANQRCCIGRGLAALRPYPGLDRDFMLLGLKALESDLASLGFGSTFVAINKKQLTGYLFPLPPLAEQHRIVGRVNELMAVCDQLEAAKAEREQCRDSLVTASLQGMNQPADEEETYREHARFTFTILPRITTRAAHIKQLRQAILNLAVRGKLVPQDPSDEPASELLKRIAAEISSFSRANRCSLVTADSISNEDMPFSKPHGWEWTRLCELFRVITDGDHQPPPRADEGIAFLTIGNITTGQLDFSGCRLVPEPYYKSLAAYRTPAPGDILYTVVGATYGRPAVVNTDRSFCVQRHIAIMKPAREMSTRYLTVLLSSSLIYDQATQSTTGTAQPTIALRPLRNFLAPLPPFAEQHRIVAKVDELMAICDQLEAQITVMEQNSRRFLEAVLNEVLSPSLLEDE